jgi:hypothetical protein
MAAALAQPSERTPGTRRGAPTTATLTLDRLDADRARGEGR